MASNKGLGKGLGALLGDFSEEPASDSAYRLLPIYKVEPNPDQPRHDFDEEELQALQDELESQFGRMADGINLVTGAFDDQAASIDSLISKYSDLSDRELERSITSLENGQKESTAIGLNTAAVWDADTISANQYFISRAKAHGADTKFANMYGGTAYFEWDYEKRSKALRAVADDMIDMYNETGIEAYNTIAQRIEAEIPAVQEGADQLKELRQESVVK